MGVIKRFARIPKSQIEGLKDVFSKEKIQLALQNTTENFDLDKSWELIHFLITGEKAFESDHPFSILFSPKNSTLKISDEEHDFYWDEMSNQDPIVLKKWKSIETKISLNISYLNSEDITTLLEIFQELIVDDQISKTDFNTLNAKLIYPEIWSDSNEHKEYAKLYWKKLNNFIEKAHSKTEYIIVF